MKPEQLGVKMDDMLRERKSPDPIVGTQLAELRGYHRDYTRAFAEQPENLRVLVNLIARPLATEEQFSVCLQSDPPALHYYSLRRLGGVRVISGTTALTGPHRRRWDDDRACARLARQPAPHTSARCASSCGRHNHRSARGHDNAARSTGGSHPLAILSTTTAATTDHLRLWCLEHILCAIGTYIGCRSYRRR
eukprot:scaffold267356_cov35-Tisochrysis_lutea.AAC.7